MRKNFLSIGLQRNSSERTDKSLTKLENAKQLLRDLLISGEIRTRLEMSGSDEVKPSDVLRLAGLNPRFLHGSRHKHSTKLELDDFLTGLNGALGEVTRSARPADPGEPDWQERYRELQEQYERTLTRIHGWQLRMMTLSRENREMKKKLGMKVVPIKP
ncbi:hypothetical protein [Sinorhizobium meliloti]|uniref:hypothetical protein n=1 Tax=Rhizobium meliloti TaxID=382 RepID=UPI000F23F214|nr:hypothetical protein [Sinorhizobium meliloti]RMI22786.1 hypothetical protein DA102_010225 [Sinorhizobium meliloti]RVI90311.1 hypothetical protein CN193_33240 [Sinorhizobium meliloti]RVK44217.1 hypothetical protein CN155_34345 [Sinorhizobium meliloti]